MMSNISQNDDMNRELTNICQSVWCPATVYPDGHWEYLGDISLKFCELSKILSRNLYIAKIVLLVRISSWNFARVPKAMLCSHVQSFSLKFSPYIWFLALYIFTRLFQRARKTLLKQPRLSCTLSLVSKLLIETRYSHKLTIYANNTK